MAAQAQPRLSNPRLYPTKSALDIAFRVARNAKIPQLPEVVLELRKEMGKEDPDLDRAAKLIAKDPGMTGKVLRTVNSPAFSVGNKITNLQQAGLLLGLNRLGNLVMAATVDAMAEDKAGPVRPIWEAIMEEARLIARVAQVVPNISPDEAYLYGVMHDVGALIFASQSDDYAEMWALNVTSTPKALLEYERTSMGVDHMTVGFLLAHHWQLPDFVALAIYQHHSPGALLAQDSKVSAMVALSKLAHYLGAQTKGVDELLESAAHRNDAWAELRISDRDWGMLCEQFGQRPPGEDA